MALSKNYNKILIYTLTDESNKALANQVGTDYNLKKEIPIEGAYFQIKTISGGKEQIKLNVYIFDNANKENLLDTKTYLFTPSLDGDSNFIKQGYEYLKTLEEYAGAIDVLEE